MIQRRYSGNEQICYTVSHFLFCSNVDPFLSSVRARFLGKAKELFDILEDRRLSSDLIELRDMLKARYELLLQGVHADVTPEFSRYLERILNLDFVPDEYSYRRKTKSQRIYPTRLEESDILKEVLDDSLFHYTSYFFEQDLSSANAKFSPRISFLNTWIERD